jgi:hypothetical protein
MAWLGLLACSWEGGAMPPNLMTYRMAETAVFVCRLAEDELIDNIRTWDSFGTSRVVWILSNKNYDDDDDVRGTIYSPPEISTIDGNFCLFPLWDRISSIHLE